MAEVKPEVKEENGVNKENKDDLTKKIIRQVEYYFGDFNLPRDKFLQAETKTDDGWVSMETMLNFKRLAELSRDIPAIIAALRQSKAGLIQVSEDALKIRREPSIPLPENTEESRKLLEARTAYAKGFDKDNTTMDELIDHFNTTNPDVVSVQMRNWCEKKGKEKVWKFKGSIFLTFKTEEAASAFVTAEAVEYRGAPLVRKFQKEYFAEKAKEVEERKAKYGNKKQKKEGEGEGKEEVKEEVKEEEFVLPKGSVLKLTGLGGEVTREDIKEVLKDQCQVNIEKDGGDIAFITYEKGEAEAKIRFKKEDGAKAPAAALAALEKVEIKGLTVAASLLEGEEEDKFLADSAQDLRNRRNKNKGFKAGQKRRGGGHHGHGGKRGRR